VDRHAEALNRVLARLEWAFARMRGFSADAAHELRTPINRMLAVTDVAALHDSEPAHWERALGQVHETAEEMRRLVDSLLLLSRGEEGRIRLQRSRLELAELLAQLGELYGPLADEKQIELEIESEPVEVWADRELLARAVANLLENAIRHAPAGGRVRLDLRRSPGGAILEVADSGPGVPAQDREWIFERFTQRDASRSGGGCGLGLPIVRMVARLHGGDVEVGDSPLGGAVFSIRFPLARSASSEGPPAEAVGRESGATPLGKTAWVESP
jgi:signal transduction histidine kinase